MNESSNGGAGRKALGVFAIIERKDTTKPPYWMKIGSAFTNKDGSVSLYLDAFPATTNKLQVREVRPFDESRAAASNGHRAPHDGEVRQ